MTMIDKDFQRSLAIMLFAMVAVVIGSWVTHAVTVPKVAPTPSQLVV